MSNPSLILEGLTEVGNGRIKGRKEGRREKISRDDK